MSLCPTCPTCGAFAPWEISSMEVRESDRDNWPTEERFIRTGRTIMCVNGHIFPERLAYQEPKAIKRGFGVQQILDEMKEGE